MKGSLMLLGASILLIGMGNAADAGPNAGGLIIAHDANLIYTTDTNNYCGLGSILSSCEARDTNLEGSTYQTWKVWKMYAVFPANSSPRMTQVMFGINYPYLEITVSAWGGCGDSEQAYGAWPASDTGVSVFWDPPQTDQLVECYWFAGYHYSALNPAVFQLRDNPGQGGYFFDDSIPGPQRDEISCYGSIGFDTIVDDGCCPSTSGACCYPDGTCTFMPESDCRTGDWHEGIPCEPNPCHVIPTDNSSWGRIKRGYR